MVTIYSQITCISKILTMREAELPRLVAEGKMDAEEAEDELMRLKATLNTLKEVEDNKQLKLKLT